MYVLNDIANDKILNNKMKLQVHKKWQKHYEHS